MLFRERRAKRWTKPRPSQRSPTAAECPDHDAPQGRPVPPISRSAPVGDVIRKWVIRTDGVGVRRAAGSLFPKMLAAPRYWRLAVVGRLGMGRRVRWRPGPSRHRPTRSPPAPFYSEGLHNPRPAPTPTPTVQPCLAPPPGPAPPPRRRLRPSQAARDVIAS